MYLVNSAAVDTSLERIFLELAVPDERRKGIDGAPLVASFQEGNTAR